MKSKDVANFVFEMGMLRRVKHEGWRFTGVKAPESVADHTLRAAQIGFLLAKMERYDKPEEVCTILIFHDNGETRIGDIHRIANRYVKANEEQAVKDQTSILGETGKEIFSLWKQMQYGNTRAGRIAKDADLLEQAFTAKEYMEKGYKFAEDWLKNISKFIKTESAKDLMIALKRTNSNDWWQGLKKLE